MKRTPIQATVVALIAALSCASAGASDPKLVTFPANIAINVALKLLPAAGKVGRVNPIYDNYRPQVQFSGERDRVTCAVRIPQSIEKVEPGQTEEVVLVCGERVRVIEDRRSFTVYEGGRLVGEGQVK